MSRLDRRALLSNVFVGASLVLAGCTSRPGDGESTVSTTTAGDPTTSTDAPTTESPTRRDEPTNTPLDPDLETECITSRFRGYVGTTPVPAPEKPDELDRRTAIEFAVSYERYYERYLALYEIGVPTPENENHSAHGFPEVRLEVLQKEVPTETDDGFVVRLSFSRFFEDDYRGEFTVTYYVSAEHTIRAEAEGHVSPGPDPLAAGRLMTC